MDEIRRDSLTGSWKLVALHFRMSDNGEQITEHPRGVCTFDGNGRWTVVSVPADMAPPSSDADRAAIFDHTVAFSGQYRIEANRMTTRVDVAWNPAFLGAELLRLIELQSDRLTVTQPEWEHPFFPGRKTTVSVVWEREQGLPRDPRPGDGGGPPAPV